MIFAALVASAHVKLAVSKSYYQQVAIVWTVRTVRLKKRNIFESKYLFQIRLM